MENDREEDKVQKRGKPSFNVTFKVMHNKTVLGHYPEKEERKKKKEKMGNQSAKKKMQINKGDS